MLAARRRSSAGTVVNVPSRGADDQAAALEADEETAGPILHQRPDHVLVHALKPAKCRRGTVAEPDRAARDGADPETTLPVLEHRAHAILGKAVRRRQGFDAVADQPADAAGVGGKPDAPGLVLQNDG